MAYSKTQHNVNIFAMECSSQAGQSLTIFGIIEEDVLRFFLRLGHFLIVVSDNFSKLSLE